MISDFQEKRWHNTKDRYPMICTIVWVHVENPQCRRCTQAYGGYTSEGWIWLGISIKEQKYVTQWRLL
jgi:hypothetical protein